MPNSFPPFLCPVQSIRPISWRKKTLGQEENTAYTAPFKPLPLPTRSLQSHLSDYLTGNNPFLNIIPWTGYRKPNMTPFRPSGEDEGCAVFWSALRYSPPKGELRMAPNKRAWTGGLKPPPTISAPQYLRSSMHEPGDQPAIVPRQSCHLLQRFALQQKASEAERSIINRWLYAHPSEQTHSLGSSLKLGSTLKNRTCKQKKKGKLRYHPRFLGRR